MRVAILDKSHMGYALNLLKADGWTQDCLIYYCPAPQSQSLSWVPKQL